jgi:hypothetical protein
MQVPAITALDQGERARIYSVSCGSPGNCSAGGYYTDSLDNSQAFVISQANGIWHDAIEVPGTALLNDAGQAEIDSVSCTSGDYFSAGGSYTANFGSVGHS